MRYRCSFTADIFNIMNNTLDVNLLYTNAGQETAASDPRQFQFGACRSVGAGRTGNSNSKGEIQGSFDWPASSLRMTTFYGIAFVQADDRYGIAFAQDDDFL